MGITTLATAGRWHPPSTRSFPFEGEGRERWTGERAAARFLRAAIPSNPTLNLTHHPQGSERLRRELGLMAVRFKTTTQA